MSINSKYFILFFTAIAEAIGKWKAEKEARLAGGGGAKEVEEEEEYIYAVKDDEVMVQAEHHTSDVLHCIKVLFVHCGCLMTVTIFDYGKAHQPF